MCASQPKTGNKWAPFSLWQSVLMWSHNPSDTLAIKIVNRNSLLSAEKFELFCSFLKIILSPKLYCPFLSETGKSCKAAAMNRFCFRHWYANECICSCYLSIKRTHLLIAYSRHRWLQWNVFLEVIWITLALNRFFSFVRWKPIRTIGTFVQNHQLTFFFDGIRMWKKYHTIHTCFIRLLFCFPGTFVIDCW